MARTPKLLVIDAYDEAGRDSLTGAGGTRAGALYRDALLACIADADIAVFTHGEDRDVPGGGIEAFDGIVWTGSSMTIHKPTPAVEEQIQIAQEGFEKGIPQFGSCWAAQLSVVAAGGTCGFNPKGREFGITGAITITEEGKRHPLFQGRSSGFKSFTSHGDIVASLPEGATCLAYNDFTPIQAVAIRHGAGEFWAVQYHPEFSFYEVARIGELWRRSLVKQGQFTDEAAADAYIAALDAVQDDPESEETTARLGVGANLLEEDQRLNEVRNWLEYAVMSKLNGSQHD